MLFYLFLIFERIHRLWGKTKAFNWEKTFDKAWNDL